MKKSIYLLIFSLISVYSFAQQASEIDPKFVKFPRYADLSAITSAITSPTQGMMVYNIGTGSNWSYNGTLWKDLKEVPNPLVVTNTTIGTIGLTAIKGESIVTYPPLYSGPDAFGGIGLEGISDGGIYGSGVLGRGYGPLNVGVFGVSPYRGVTGFGSLAGTGVYGSSDSGIPGVFEITDFFNTSNVIVAKTQGPGKAIDASNYSNTNPTAKLRNANTTGLAIETSGGLKFGGTNVGTPAAGKVLTATDAVGNATWQVIPAVVAPLSLTAASGTTFSSTASGSGGDAGFFQITNSSNPNTALTASTNGLNKAGLFQINNGSNGNAAILCESNGTGQTIYATMFGTGTGLIVEHAGASGNIATFISSGNKARIDKAGKGFFNGGTQATGADIAEAFDVIGERNSYEIGDVLVISENQDRAVEQSSKPYSPLVAGVYATKPGVLLTEETIDTDLSDKVPMGVVGVIPTKVCNEGGTIKRGDLLVSSSKKGYAMKADPSKIGFGQCIGKALQNFDEETGIIKVLVNVK